MATEPRRRHPNQGLLFLTLLAIPWIWGNARYDAGYPALEWRLVNSLLALLVGHAVFAIQLGGQLLGARLVRDRIIWAQLGFGRALYARSRIGWTFSWCALPGDVVSAIVTTRERGQRLRTAVSTLGGLLAVAMPLVILRLVHPTPFAELRVALTTRAAPDAVFTYFTIILLVMLTIAAFRTLLTVAPPSSTRQDLYRTRLALGHSLEADLASERGAFDEAIAACDRGLARYPDADVLHVARANALTAMGSPAAFTAADALRGRLLSPPLRAIANHLYAWQLYVRGNAADRADAKAFSEAALAAGPRNPQYLATHGCVLLWNNELAPAEPLLVHAFKTSRARVTRAAAATGIARLCARTNRIALATTWLEHARAQDILHDLVATTAAEIEPLRRV
ncbi:MAG TPA: hypothetical protein VLT45_19960 [Kofleriaceae bacterium]|nr:hypothetical protein [Kofleriaceae bacterium]